MDKTKGDNDSVSGEATVEDSNVDVDNDKDDDNNDDEKNKEDDENNETQEETAEEEHEGTGETKDSVDEGNADDDENNDEGGKDEDEEVEKDEAGHDNQPEEEETNEADDNKETEVNECEESANEKDTEDKNEEAAAEEAEEQEGEEEGETAEAEEDNTEENRSHDLTEEEIRRCRHMFDKKAVGGRLDLKGFKTVFRVLGEIIASEEAELMFESGDRDGDNTIDLDEFLRLYSKFRQEEEARREAILDSVDKLFLCGSGDSIELKKVLQLMLKLQQPDLDARLVREKSDLGVDEVTRLVKSMDKNGDGCISKQEFVNILCEHLDI